MSTLYERAVTAYNTAIEKRDAAIAASNELPDDAPDDVVATAISAVETATADVERARAEHEKRRDIFASKADFAPIPVPDKADRTPERSAPHARSTTTKEPRTYAPDREDVSFFSDAYTARHLDDYAARGRLERHMREVVVEREAPSRAGIEERATTTGSFAGLVVPQYLVQYAALLLRAGRPVANTATNLPLPSQGLSFIVPRGTTGAAVASQATENSSVQSTDEVWANVTVPVVTIAGQQDVSRQSLERGMPGIDQLIYLDLAGAYMAELDRQIITGTGASNQILGIVNTASINAATAFGAAPSGANFSLKVAGGVQAIAGAGTMIQPQFVVMHPRRWGWLQSLADTTGRPLALATAAAPWNATGLVTAPGAYSGDGSAVATNGYQVVGVLANGLPVITDANIPTNVGTNVEDLVLVYDNRQLFLWEDGDGMPRQLRFEQTLGNQLTVKLVAYGYAAATAGRYPAAFSKIGGLDTVATQGLVAPSF